MLLKGKKVVVVGGSSGIGLSTAEMAKREGADVVIASRNVERLDAVADRLNAIAIPADVTSDDSVAKLFRNCGPVDHVVVTAAQLRTGPFKTVSMEDVRATMESKFWGAWRVAQAISASGPGPTPRSSALPTVRSNPWRGRWRSSWRRSASMRFRRGSSTRRSARPCRKRRAAKCSLRRPPSCPSAASASAKMSRVRFWPS